MFTKEYIQSMLQEPCENRFLEFKETTDLRAEQITKAITAMANGDGGRIIFGIRETKDSNPHELSPMGKDKLDSSVTRIEQFLRDLIEPQIVDIRFISVEMGANEYVLVADIKKSWNAPHKASDGKFYIRRNSMVDEISLKELRDMFILGGTIERQVDDFVVDRIDKIQRQSNNISLDSKSYSILHIIPVGSFSNRILSNKIIDYIGNNAYKTISGEHLHFNGVRHNSYGVVLADTFDVPSSFYLQSFRSGAIEFVDAYSVASKYGIASKLLIEHIKLVVDFMFKDVYPNMSIGFPFYLTISLIGAKDVQFHTGNHVYHRTPRIDSDFVKTGYLYIDKEFSDVGSELKPLFDVIWNSAGLKEANIK